MPMRKILFILLCLVAVQVEAQVPGDNAITPEKKEDTPSATGDPGIFIFGVRNDNMATGLSGTNGDYTAISVDSNGGQFLAYGSAFAPLKLEDAVAASGDAGVAGLGVLNTALTNSAANGDYGLFALGAWGQTLSTLVYDSSSAIQANSPVRIEDNAFGASEAVMVVGAQAKDAIAQTVGASLDIAPPSMDLGNRLITTSAPSGEMLQGCSAEVTTVTTANIVNAVASKYNFMTGVTCTNTGAAATRVVIEDGDGVDMATLNLAATIGYATATFPSPGIRTNAVNKVIRASVITTGSATICCISGFLGTI